jgi:hypothetical protein
MTLPLESDSRETLTLPTEVPREHAALLQEWTTAFPDPNPVERGWIEQAVRALIALRCLARVQETRRTQGVRLAVLFYERTQEDQVAHWLDHFNIHPPSARVGLLRSAAGCRWAIQAWLKLDSELKAHGTWYGEFRLNAIQLQGLSACVPKLYYSVQAFTTWVDALATQPNPKQKDIDRVVNPQVIPKGLVERGIPVWPRDPDACRARMRALIDTELPRLRALEETLRTQFEDPERAEAQVSALAVLDREDRDLLRAQRMHEQSYLQASTAFLKVRGRQTTAAAPVRRDHPNTEQTRENMKAWYSQWWRPPGKVRAVPGPDFRHVRLAAGDRL